MLVLCFVGWTFIQVTAPTTLSPCTCGYRASSLLSSLRQAEHAKMAAAHAEKAIPEFRPGDAIEVKVRALGLLWKGGDAGVHLIDCLTA